jgi:hypothetical protein
VPASATSASSAAQVDGASGRGPAARPIGPRTSARATRSSTATERSPQLRNQRAPGTGRSSSVSAITHSPRVATVASAVASSPAVSA